MKSPNDFSENRPDQEGDPSDEERMRRYFDGELSPEEERAALLQIAEDPLLREWLRMERELPARLQELEAAKAGIPDGFSDRVMQAVAERDVQRRPQHDVAADHVATETVSRGREETEQAILERLARVLEKMMAPVRFELRPVWALAALLALAGGSLALWGPGGSGIGLGAGEHGPVARQGPPSDGFTAADAPLATRVVAEETGSVWIRFVFIDPEAEELAVAGDFTGWEPMALTREQVGDRQVWTGMIQVPRGEHHYMFIRNGEEWVTDPFADITRDDGFGNENAVLYL
ncbi:MAG: glycogen-binding domain-containing protein [Balneolaceae bacterium]